MVRVNVVRSSRAVLQKKIKHAFFFATLNLPHYINYRFVCGRVNIIGAGKLDAPNMHHKIKPNWCVDINHINTTAQCYSVMLSVLA